MPNSKPFCPKIILFGHFGAGNFGNESTFEAMLCHLRRMLPGAQISCICSRPEIVSARYNIAAVPISGVTVKASSVRNPIVKLLRKLFVGIPRELYRWLKAGAVLWGTDTLIVVGTGLLTDSFGVYGWGPFGAFRWAVIAKLCGCQLMFVSVGAGPLEHRSGRLLVRAALYLADFRSYRDATTLEYLKTIGLQCHDDKVYPDLAFSLIAGPSTRIAERRRRPIVAIGLMSHDGMYNIERTTNSHYAAYLETLVVFVRWLLEHEYDVRLLSSDVMDVPAVRHFRSLLNARSVVGNEARIVIDPIISTEDVMSKLAATDFVVATRFHNVLLALLLNKPSISISFHYKCVSLMKDMGLSEYYQDINHLDADRLIEQFCDLEKNAEKLRVHIKLKTDECRAALDEQYRFILNELSA